MVDASVKRGASEEKTRISNLMDAVMTASGGRTRISVLMDAVMKASKADDADVFSEECCISHVLSSDAKKNLERSKKRFTVKDLLLPMKRASWQRSEYSRTAKHKRFSSSSSSWPDLSVLPHSPR
jgi:hypothetical protein